MLYGGAAGGGKTDLLLGLAATAHYKAIIFRRQYPQLKGIVQRSRDLFRGVGSFNANDNLWRLDDGRLIEFGAVQHDDDKNKYQGRDHDLKAFDELTHFTESQYVFLTGWARTARPGQRVRIVAASNPPTSADGEWVLRRWGAWLDGKHPHPAKPGELRWYAMVDGEEVERADGTPFEHNGQQVIPKSRTFIPARLGDNPYLAQSGYEATLQAMPEPLRSQLLYGDFTVGIDDDPWQVIPTEWVRLAQARWTPDGRPKKPDGTPMPLTSVGVDVARGGQDETVLAPRYGNWIGELDTHPGASTPNGGAVASLVMKAIADGGFAAIDVIGVGASVFDICAEQTAEVVPVNNSSAVKNWDRTGTMRFVNMRAYSWWSMREALDPEKGDGLALPPDNQLLADLCTPKWTMQTNGIKIEGKEDIKKRTGGRSPDRGDAVVLACIPGLYMGGE